MTVASLFSARAAGAVDVDFDATVLIQVVFFLVLLAILKPVLFDPMLKLFEEREKRIEGRIKKARDIDSRSAQSLTEYEAAMAKARAEAGVQREKLRSEGQRVENEVLEKMRGVTAQTLDAGRGKASSELSTVRAQLRGGASDLARDIASSALGREVSG